ncbi:DNA polymerase III subunit gamma/tau C-terminal domain-containing protein [Halopseudomonas pachastrellae]|nr:DNA polymerase III subunit gamma/tau C-terminal domain-containing protein [Halopseudomonas pachastrellae]
MAGAVRTPGAYRSDPEYCRALSAGRPRAGQLDLASGPGASALYNENHRKRLEQAISAVQEQPVQLLVEVPAPTQETPAVAAARRKAARQRAAEQSIVADTLVQRLQSDFAAHICEGSIRPLDAPPTELRG